MEVNQQRAEAAKACFDFNKNLNTVNVTSDLECFGDRNAAVNHARTLEDSTIDVFDREIDGIEWNEDESDNYSAEAFDIPDYDLAKAKAEGSENDEAFEQNTPPVAPEPVVEQTPVIEQPSAMDNLVKDPEQVTQTGVVAESGQAATQDLQAVETASAVTPVIAKPGKPAVLAEPAAVTQAAESAAPAEPVILSPTQKRLNTLAAKKAAAAEKAQEGK